MYHGSKGAKRQGESNSYKHTTEEGLEGVEIPPSDLDIEEEDEENLNPFTMKGRNKEMNEQVQNLLSSGNASNTDIKGILEINRGGNEFQYNQYPEEVEYEQEDKQNEQQYDYQNENQNDYPNDHQNELYDDHNPNFGKGVASARKEENQNETYREMLEQKVRKQAKRLCELQEYKSLCEKRIRQLSPGHPLPVVDQHISNVDKSVTSQVQEIQFNNIIQSNKFQIHDLTNKLVNKENELNTLQKKYEILQNKYNNYVNESIPKSLLKNYNFSNLVTTYPGNENLFPFPDRVPNEKMRDAYAKLHSAFKELMKEKEQILNSLRQETINNDEQRNYIEILKQTIESSLVKHGLLSMIEKQRTSHYKSSNNYYSNVDVIIDFVQLKNETDKCRKELIQSEVIINELRQEMDFLKETNDEMNSKKEKIKESLENGIRELEEAKERVRSLELEKEYLADELNELKDYSDKILKEYETCLERNTLLEKEIEDFRQQISDQTILENKLSEYKSNFEKLSQELENLIGDKDSLEDRVKSLGEENSNLIGKNENLEKIVKDLNNSNKELNEKLDNSQKSIEKVKSKNDELNRSLNQSLKLLSETERNLNNLQSEFGKLKKESEESNSKLQNLQTNYDSIVKEKEAMGKEVAKFKSDNNQLMLENDKFRIEANEFSNNFNKILQQYETTNKNYKNLETLYNETKMEKENLIKELSITKEKVGNEEYNKVKEINKLTNQMNTIKSEKSEMETFLNTEITKLKEQLNESMVTRNESEMQMKRDYNVLKIKYEELLNAKNYFEIEIIEKDKYIRKLEDEMAKKNLNVKIASNQSASAKFENAYHEVKLAIHSCLSVANVFMQKYNKIYDRNLDESFCNFNSNNDYNAVLESLHNLEDWLNVVCRELEDCYIKSQTESKPDSNSKSNQEAILRLKQLTEDYNKLYNSHEKSQKELRSYKNDNKKLYDQNKKLYEESLKFALILKENKNLEEMLKSILSNYPHREVAKMYFEMINLNELITNLESDRIKLQRRADSMEKELQRNRANNSGNKELEGSLLKEIDNLKIIIADYESKINDKKERLQYLENEIKGTEEKIGKESGGLNVFKANYVDRNNGNNKQIRTHTKFENLTTYDRDLNPNSIQDSSNLNNQQTVNSTINQQINAPSTSYYRRVKDIQPISTNFHN